MANNKISIFLGAGAESEYGMCNGNDFKRDTILCVGAADFLKNFNNNNERFNKVTNSKFIRSDSTNILYQSCKELNDSDLNDFKSLIGSNEDRNTIEDYAKYRKGEFGGDENKTKRNTIKEKFKILYKEKVYNPIAAGKTPEILKYLSFYSTIDSDFNYLRLPDIYVNECNNVMKLYFSAYLSILKNIVSKRCYKDIVKKGGTINKKDFIEKYEEKIKEIADPTKDSYYKTIKENINSINCIVTTNYTTILDSIINDSEKCIHIHGEMNKFEDLYSKQILNGEDLTEDSIVFPYIAIQSGVKPVINEYQIERYHKAFDELKKSKIIIVLGYSFSSDDEHIISFFKSLLKGGKHKIYYLYYVKDVNNESDKVFTEEATKKLTSIFAELSEKIEVKILSGHKSFKEHLITIIEEAEVM